MSKTATVTTLLQRLGQRQNDAVLAAQMKLEFDVVQARLEGGVQIGGGIFMLSGLIYVDTSLSLVVGNSGIQPAVPTSFISELEGEEESPLEYQNDTGNYTSLKKDDYQILKTRFASFSSSGHIEAYAQRGQRVFAIFPTPSAAYNLRWTYYKREAVITDLLDNAFTGQYQELMISELGIVACKYYIISPERLATFQDSRDREAQRIYTQQIMQEQSGRMYARGDD